MDVYFRIIFVQIRKNIFLYLIYLVFIIYKENIEIHVDPLYCTVSDYDLRSKKCCYSTVLYLQWKDNYTVYY
jgi:hypothetical protein